MSDANEPDPVSDANEPDPAGEDTGPTDVASLRLEVVAGGDPGVETLAAIATILTRPVVVQAMAQEESDEAEEEVVASQWTRAARLEGIVPGRRITTRADLSWRRTA